MITLHDKVFEPFILEDEILDRIGAIGATLSAEYAEKKPLIIAVLNGSFMVAADLMKSISIDCEISFVKVSSYHGTTSTGRVDELIGLNTAIRGRHIILLEDIVDTGVTVDKVLKLLSAAGPASVKTCTLLFKPDAFKGKKTPDYIGFSVPELFVVGYGLDYDELGRNLRDIYKLKQD
ncbi:MAG: hypoxanthine phosphoribosyltransferase [Bacteroidota bacterium]